MSDDVAELVSTSLNIDTHECLVSTVEVIHGNAPSQHSADDVIDV